MENNQQNINDILTDPDKLVDSSENLLTRMFRTILADNRIGPKNFAHLVKRYLHDPNSGIEDNPTSRNNHRGNLMKELSNVAMTWNVFQKSLRVIGVEEYELVLNIKRKGVDVVTQHVVYARNNIASDEIKEDLSDARIIDGFLSTPSVVEETVVVSPEETVKSIQETVKTFKLPDGAKHTPGTKFPKA